jgi:hypothetical protein
LGKAERKKLMETTNPNRQKMDITISKEAYEKYLGKKAIVSNARLRSANEDFYDALLSVDMTVTPEGRDILDAIRKLG